MPSNLSEKFSGHRATIMALKNYDDFVSPAEEQTDGTLEQDNFIAALTVRGQQSTKL